MDLYKMFQTEEDLEKSGIRITYGVNKEGKEVAIIVARAGGRNSAFQRVADSVLKPYRRLISNESIDPKQLRSLMMLIYARAVVLGWENVSDATGKPLEFSEDNCVKLFNDLPDLFADIQNNADNLSLFRKEALEEEAKN